MNYKDECRTFLTDWYSKMELLSLLVPVKAQKKAIGRYRKLLTQPEKHFPIAEEMRSEFVRYDLKKFAMTVLEYKDDNPGHMDIGVCRGRLELLCRWFKIMKDTYEQRNPKLDKDGRPMMNIHEWRGARLKDKQMNKTDSSGQPTTSDLVQVELEPHKALLRLHKRYEKEWKEKND